MSTRYIYAALVAYVLGFVLFPPRAFLVVDEERYVSQAVAFAHGRLGVPGAEILHPPAPTRLISNFPPGTSLLQTPFVAIGGWRWAALLSVISLVAATLVTLRWLKDSGAQPAFALLVPAYFAALFFGRLGMSDVPSGALVAGVAYLLWRADRERPTASFFAGFLAGASLLFREPLILLVAPLLIGAVARRRVAIPAVLVGSVLGVGLRLVASALLFGSATYVRDSGYGFSAASLAHTAPVYAFALLLAFPAAALLPFFYRGARRAELVAALALYFPLFLFYDYDSIRENGPVKGLIVASRYVIPALPLLAYMAAEVWPRWQARLAARGQRALRLVATLAAAGVVLGAFAIHPLARRQEAEPAAIVRGIYSHTTADVPVITNALATLKYFSPSYGPRKLIISHGLLPDSALALIARNGGRARLAFLNRSDSEMFREQSLENDRFAQVMAARCRVSTIEDARIGDWARLRISEASGCR